MKINRHGERTDSSQIDNFSEAFGEGHDSRQFANTSCAIDIIEQQTVIDEENFDQCLGLVGLVSNIDDFSTEPLCRFGIWQIQIQEYIPSS